ncbi:MAG: RagB/SusD family nutrient uptake outer membrane protein [Muribaculaceae bacterium]|nr:RagB/SusD family nutrient uptake outer membrane protein [Muribaculaceae bacterium]
MNIFKTLMTAAAAAVALSGYAQSVEVVQVKYSDGVIDYIPAEEVARISISKSLDSESPAFNKVITMFGRLKEIFLVSSNHFDFGYPAIMIGLDSQTEDMAAPESGYNWFSAWSSFSKGNVWNNALMWRYMYNAIASANDVIANTDTDNDENKLLVAQARGLRSWAYWNLVQTYAPNPAFVPDAKGIVILPGTTTEGTYPEASVRDVYALITEDIDQAIELLGNNELAPANLDVPDAKRYIDLGVAYGLRARYNLTQHKYAEAAADARHAIETTSARLLQRAAAAYPGFNDSKLGNWMWSIIVRPTDAAAISGIANFSSMVSSLSYGYTAVGISRCCGTDLHNYLEQNPDDVRRNWFVDDSWESHVLTESQNRYVNSNFNGSACKWPNIKFDAYLSKVGTNDNAADVPLMRVEEMYLIEAEGLAMSGRIAEALDVLNSFVHDYRNASYDFTSIDPAEIQNEIIWQRRAEFWGEGLAFFDKLRLQLDVNRLEDENWPENVRYGIRGGSDWMRYNYVQLQPFVEGVDYEAISTVTPAPGEWND